MAPCCAGVAPSAGASPAAADATWAAQPKALRPRAPADACCGQSKGHWQGRQGCCVPLGTIIRCLHLLLWRSVSLDFF
eukprot:12903062-Prorocentrum_lima.AAC.1